VTHNSTQSVQERTRAMWNAGDFGVIARYGAVAADRVVAGLPIPLGARVLDVACGTGNFAIPAARRGASVTGLDLAGNLLRQARARAADERLDARFDEGDVEDLPYADGSFDVIMALFGAMFAEHAERMAAEITRVCRPGGTILMANWTARGFIGEMFALSARYLPARKAPAAVLWGEEEVVRERLADKLSALRMRREVFPFEFPFGPGEVVQLFGRCFGPTITMLSTLDEAGRAKYMQDFEALWRTHNVAGDERTLVQAEYLEVVATRGEGL
jgi:ubiquinone/menaquinone biosynthesis C-methylase UbiE